MAEDNKSNRRSAAFKKQKQGGNKPRTKQPKKVKFITTEIKCQEMSKGGLAYEVILAEPVGSPLVPKRPISPGNKTPSAKEIEDKLKAAEERRMNLEATKIAAIGAKIAKIEEASRKKDEQTNIFISNTKEALDAKMEIHVEKREAYINDLKSKVKDHLEGVEKTRLLIEQQTDEIRKSVEDKLNIAATKKDENMKKLLDRLKEHEEQVQKVRTNNSERFHQLESAIQEKLDHASTRRAQIELEQKEKLRNYNTVKIADVRSNAEEKETSKSSEVSNDLKSKLTIAEQNREKEIQKKLDNIKKQERRAEMVRQNKAALAEQNGDGVVTAQSG